MQLVVFASGNGSNFEAIVKAHDEGKIKSKVKLLIVDKKDAYVIKRAENLGVSYKIIELSNYESKEEYELEIIRVLKEVKPDLICLAGYMKLVSNIFLKEYEGKIINIHPSLLPKYKGKRAVLDALEAKEDIIGVTVHFVNQELDAGKIIKQTSFNIKDLSYEQVEELLHKKEHKLYIDVIKEMEE